MARALRIKYLGSYYHVMIRGNRREDIFISHNDRATIADGLADSNENYDVRLIDHVLMPKHLLVQTTQANLSEFIRLLAQNTAPSARAERV